jgi:hypothetical protein
VRAEDCTRFSFLQDFGSWVQISGFLLVKLLRGKSLLFGVCRSFFFFLRGDSRSFSSSSSEQYIRYRIVGAAGFSVFLRELLCCVRGCVRACFVERVLFVGSGKGKFLAPPVLKVPHSLIHVFFFSFLDFSPVTLSASG